VLEVAAKRFYSEGIRAVGVEAIVKEAEVAKISLYRRFASKDDLIVAYLQRRNADYWRTVDEVIGKDEGDPRAQLRALIAHLASRTSMPGYRGCPFVKFAAEFPETAHPGHEVVRANKSEMRRRLIGLVGAMGARRPSQLADALFLLIEGAYSSSQTLGGRDGPARSLLHAAENLIASHLSA
jgi:AcrR family transcriptional regulator